MFGGSPCPIASVSLCPQHPTTGSSCSDNQQRGLPAGGTKQNTGFLSGWSRENLRGCWVLAGQRSSAVGRRVPEPFAGIFGAPFQSSPFVWFRDQMAQQGWISEDR